MTNRSSARLARHRIVLLVLALGTLTATTACTSAASSSDAPSSVVSSSSSTAGQPTQPEQTQSADASTGSGASDDETATVSIPPAVTTPVPAPGGGDISETVSAVEMTSQAPVALDEAGDFGDGVTVVLDKVDKITTEAQLPGEIAGPGLALTFTITNDAEAEIDLSTVVVDVADATGLPAISMTAAPSAPFSGELAAGGKATGTYVVTLPKGSADPVTISVTYSSKAPVVVFTGPAS